jgi:hypothetical protein
LQVLLSAVDRDNMRATLGQQPHGRGADDADRAGDDRDRAVRANSIGHVVRFPWLIRLSRISGGSAHGARTSRDYFICGVG